MGGGGRPDKWPYPQFGEHAIFLSRAFKFSKRVKLNLTGQEVSVDRLGNFVFLSGDLELTDRLHRKIGDRKNVPCIERTLNSQLKKFQFSAACSICSLQRTWVVLEK